MNTTSLQRNEENDEKITLIIRTPTSTRKEEKDTTENVNPTSFGKKTRPSRPSRNRRGLLDFSCLFDVPLSLMIEDEKLLLQENRGNLRKNNLVTYDFWADVEFSSRHICTICMDHIRQHQQVSQLDCGHYFHYECIRNWGRIKQICPCCKKPIRCE